MMRAIDGVPLFGASGDAEAVLASFDGRADHVCHEPTIEGVGRTAREMAGARFPRIAVARALEEYGRSIGAPAAAIENARALADESTLVVATGQQPCAALGPLYVLYKALTAVALAADASRELGVRVVPVFWNASEDHDLDEVAAAAAPARDGSIARYRADLEAWRGMSIASIPAGAGWAPGMREWISTLGDTATAGELAPRDDETWSRWCSRCLVALAGGRGLVVMEPQILRPFSVEVYARAAREHERIQASIRQSCEERAVAGRSANFGALDGPPLFVEREGRRRRVHAETGSVVLRGGTERLSADELVRLVRERPEAVSSHAALRPIVQNVLMPVVAAVVGPGEIAYHEELLRFHRSDVGAGRRMPVLWPRASITIVDGRSAATMERFGVEPRDLFGEAQALLARYTPTGDLAALVREAARRAGAAIEGFRARTLALDATLERPLGKTLETIDRAAATFADKVERAEAQARGFAPDRLRQLFSFVRPGGGTQERTFCVAWALAATGRAVADEIASALNIHDRRHALFYAGRGGDGHGG